MLYSNKRIPRLIALYLRLSTYSQKPFSYLLVRLILTLVNSILASHFKQHGNTRMIE